MTSFGEYRRLIEQEQREERRAAIDVGATSFADILRFNKLDVEWPSFETKKGERKDVLVRGQDIADSKTWVKFLLHSGRNASNFISLVTDLTPLAEAYDNFLAANHTERYRNLDGDGMRWRKRVAFLVVRYYIMENKLEGYLRGEDTFADERVAYYYTLVRTIRTAMTNAARVINHIIKDEEKSQHYLKEFFTAHYEQFRSIPFPQRDGILQIVALEEEQV